MTCYDGDIGDPRRRPLPPPKQAQNVGTQLVPSLEFVSPKQAHNSRSLTDQGCSIPVIKP